MKPRFVNSFGQRIAVAHVRETNPFSHLDNRWVDAHWLSPSALMMAALWDWGRDLKGDTVVGEALGAKLAALKESIGEN